MLDGSRSQKKGVMAGSLEELVQRGRAKLGYASDREVTAVLEEDGTEVDEEDYFATLPDNTALQLLCSGERWRLAGLETLQETMQGVAGDRVDHGAGEGGGQARLAAVLARLQAQPGNLALLGEEVRNKNSLLILPQQ